MKGIRHALAAALIILALGLCASVVSEGLAVSTEPGLFRVGFDLPGENFAVVRYATDRESGWFTLYSEDGRFAGASPLLCSYDPCRLTVRLERVDGRSVEQAKADYPGTPRPEGTALDFTGDRKGVRDLTLTPAEGGIAYSFTAPGHGFVWLQFRSTRQTGEVLLYPDGDYAYSGVLTLPHVYNAGNVYVTLRSGKNGTVLASGQTTKGYALRAKETEPAAGGRLNGVVVCVDPGHQNAPGGQREPLGPGLEGYSTTGGMAEGVRTNRRESIVMLECGYALRDELLRQGATVVMTREIEEKRYLNRERADIANEAGAHVMLRLHGDLNSNAGYRGFSFYHPVHSDYAKAVADRETYDGYGRILLEALAARAAYGSGVRLRLQGTDSYVGNNWAKMPCFLIELGFMSNGTDDVLLSTPEYQQWLAEGLAEGVYELAVARGVIAPRE